MFDYFLKKKDIMVTGFDKSGRWNCAKVRSHNLAICNAQATKFDYPPLLPKAAPAVVTMSTSGPYGTQDKLQHGFVG